jgi:hypothetical protein
MVRVSFTVTMHGATLGSARLRMGFVSLAAGSLAAHRATPPHLHQIKGNFAHVSAHCFDVQVGGCR